MLDFRKALKYPEGLGPKRFRPLLMLILLMGLVALVNDSLRDPVFWNLVDRMALGSTEPMPQAIDNRLHDAGRDNTMPDSFRVARKTEEPTVEEPTDGPDDDAGGYFPGVRPSELRTIRDNRPSLDAERPCAMRLLDILKNTSEESLRQASIGPVTYAQLFRQPSDYRGRLVNLLGTVRRVEPIGLPKNSYGIKAYNRVWLFPQDNPTAPMIVYCLDLPDGFPTGGSVSAQAGGNGLFLQARGLCDAGGRLRGADAFGQDVALVGRAGRRARAGHAAEMAAIGHHVGRSGGDVRGVVRRALGKIAARRVRPAARLHATAAGRGCDGFIPNR